MEENHALEFIAVQHQPATALSRVHFVVAVPGKFDGGLTIPFPEAVVYPALHIAEMEVPRALVLELEVASHLCIDEVPVPLVHRLDQPAAYDPVLWFGLAHKSPYSARQFARLELVERTFLTSCRSRKDTDRCDRCSLFLAVRGSSC